MMSKSSEKDVEHNCSVLKNLFQCAYVDKNSQFGENGNSQKYQESPGVDRGFEQCSDQTNN